jgi:hypothetical protein
MLLSVRKHLIPPIVPRNSEERMKVEMPLTPQSFVESPKSIDKKEHTINASTENTAPEESLSFFPSMLGFSRTYSVSSLKAAVAYHAKFLTVAESNLQAAEHPPTIPKAILDHFAR